MANQFLALALFIMLLSFFIILNAVSNFEDVKSRPVLNSLAMTFSDREIEEPLKPNITESVQQSVNEGDTLDQLQALFNAHITGVEAKKNRLGTTMHIRMPTPRFERAILTPVTQSAIANNEGFLPTLISLIQTRQTETPYRMDIVLNTENAAAETVEKSPDSFRVDTLKVASFSEKLQRIGMEKKLLSIGLQKGQPGFVDIYFRRYEAFDPLREEL